MSTTGKDEDLRYNVANTTQFEKLPTLPYTITIRIHVQGKYYQNSILCQTLC